MYIRLNQIEKNEFKHMVVKSRNYILNTLNLLPVFIVFVFENDNLTGVKKVDCVFSQYV
jgi:hypothetical protein